MAKDMTGLPNATRQAYKLRDALEEAATQAYELGAELCANSDPTAVWHAISTSHALRAKARNVTIRHGLAPH